jgi:hypothetical protein
MSETTQNPRKVFGTELKKLLPRKTKVVPEPKQLDELEAGHPVVMIVQTGIRHAPNAIGAYLCAMAVWVIEPKRIDPEDDLDDTLSEVITALDQLPFVNWDEAERSVYGGDGESSGFPAYRIQAQVIAQKE